MSFVYGQAAPWQMTLAPMLTLIDLAIMTVPSALGGLVGARVAVWMGGANSHPALPWVGGLIGAPLGLVAYHSLFLFLEWWRPIKPRCARGRCGPLDYEPVIHVKNPSEDEQRLLSRVERDKVGIPLRCQCGDLYLLYALRRQMWKVDTDGTLVPYQYCRPFGRWRLDTRPRSESSRS